MNSADFKFQSVLSMVGNPARPVVVSKTLGLILLPESQQIGGEQRAIRAHAEHSPGLRLIFSTTGPSRHYYTLQRDAGNPQSIGPKQVHILRPLH